MDIARVAAAIFNLETITDEIGITKDSTTKLQERIERRIKRRNQRLSKIFGIVSVLYAAWYLYTDYNFFSDLKWWAWMLVIFGSIFGFILLICLLEIFLNWLTADFDE